MNVREAFERLLAMEDSLPQDVMVEYVFVDDGSDDATHSVILEVCSLLPDRTVAIKLTRNVGVYNALLAAFTFTRGDCITVLPPDLQEPVELIPSMYGYWRSGVPVVASVRTDRNDGLLSRTASWIFHGLMRTLVSRSLPRGGYGTGLLDRRVVEDLKRMGEKNSNTLLLVAWLGYPHTIVPYVRAKRDKGRSGWSFAKKLKLFVDSTVAFSYLPVRLITAVGLLLGIAALVHAGVVLYSVHTGEAEVRGWPTLMLVVLLTSSFQTIALGMLGEYLWRTLDSVRNRPPYVIEQVLDTRATPPAPSRNAEDTRPNDALP